MLRNLLYLSICVLFLFSYFPAIAQSESDIVITEIMYNPPESGADSLEFIELYNKSGAAIDISGYSFSEGVTFTFPANTVIESEGYVLSAVNSTAFEAFFGESAFQWESGALSNGGEDIVLIDTNEAVVDSVNYNDEGEWPVEPDGSGSSLVLCNPEEDNSMGSNWAFAMIEVGANSEGDIVFAHPNGTCSEIDATPPSPTVVTTDSETMITVQYSEMVNADVATNIANYTGLDIASIDLNGISEIVFITLNTPLTLGVFETLTIANISDLAGNVMPEPMSFDIVFNNTMAELVITEIMYNDPGGEDSLEFVELQYLGTTTAQLGGYTFSEGVSFTFPTMTVEPNEYIVVSKLPEFMEEFFGVSSIEFFGGLRNSGEPIEIRNTSGEVIDVVEYDDAEPWALEADGGGYSLNLCDATMDNSDALNWSIATAMDSAGVYQDVVIYATPGSEGCKTDVGIETLDGTKIDLFPNPASTQLFVQIEGTNDWELSVFNIVGQKLLELNTFNNHLQLDVSDFETGIYFVHFQSKTTDEYYVERIIID
ncbi:MAG: lamin tail domain-containing protein [Chitinophagales bacterium]